MPLTDNVIKRAKPKDKPYKLYDEHGLYLIVHHKGGKWWRFKYSVDGSEGKRREKLLSLGVYDLVTLAEARQRRDAARKLIDNGRDPGEARKADKAATSNKFQIIAEEFVKERMEGATPPRAPRTIQKARAQLREFIYPRFGHKPIHEVTLKDIRQALQAIRVGDKRIETAYKTKELLGRIFRYAINHYEELPIRNIPADLETKEILGDRPENNLAAILEPPKVGELLRAIDGYSGQPATQAALRLLPHVFLRSTELRGGQWSEVNFRAAQWRIPKTRMKPGKTREEHIVPLSRQAVEILRDLKHITGQGDHMFPAIGPKRRPISENTLAAALATLGYDSDTQTPHGFRAIFRTLAAEELEIRIDWLELQLAHEVKDTNGEAYNRASFLKQRTEVMQQWSDYLDKLRAAEPTSHSA